MLSKVIFIFIVVLITTAAYEADLKTEDYCDPMLCYPGKKHIACNNNGTFSQRCGQDVVLVQLTEKLKMFILALHNKRRNEIAEGKVSNYPTAQRMSVLSWDNELERLAILNVKQCQMKHDECRNTKKYRFVGQNLGIRKTWPRIELYTKSIKSIVSAWFGEHKNCNETFIESYRRNPTRKKMDLFTSMIGDRTVKMGCACTVFVDKEIKKNCFLMGCNYSSSNIRNEPVYKAGEPGSGCKTGKSPRYPALCTYKEKNCVDPRSGLLMK